jgi:hypothetical protein
MMLEAGVRRMVNVLVEGRWVVGEQAEEKWVVVGEQAAWKWVVMCK